MSERHRLHASKPRRWLVLLNCFFLASQAKLFAAAGSPQVTFHYENPQLQPALYTLVVAEDGSGTFHSEPGATTPPDTSVYHPLPMRLDRPIQLTKTTTDTIFATARKQKFFSAPCEDPKNKVAFQGNKQLSYQGPDGRGSCVYNWSKFAPIEKLTTLFESIAFTLEEGRRLEVEHKHDRLAIDAELIVLSDAAKEGRATELQLIQPTLHEIIKDQEILERARFRASKLLGEPTSTASLN